MTDTQTVTHTRTGRVPVSFRAFTQADIPDIIDLCAREIPLLPSYKGIKIDRGRIKYVLENNLTNANFMCELAIAEGRPVGGVAGMVTMLAFSIQAIATDLFFFVGERYRSLYVADKLIDTYVKWAKLRKCDLITASHRSGHRDEALERLLARHGFDPVGQNYHLRGDK